MCTPDVLYSVGFTLLDRDRAHDAMHVFRTMLLVAPADERAWLGLGECHERVGELDKAVKLYTLAGQACAAAARSAVALGRALLQLDREDEAHEAFSLATSLAADDPELLELAGARR